MRGTVQGQHIAVRHTRQWTPLQSHSDHFSLDSDGMLLVDDGSWITAGVLGYRIEIVWDAVRTGRRGGLYILQDTVGFDQEREGLQYELGMEGR